MDKYEYIVNLAEKTAKRVSQNRESWMKFLTSAARIYKYPFKEQLLIYAQNPDATACASIEIWNKRMNCWVNKGSSGIALPDDTATYGHKLKYVFDVSNVHAVKPNGRYPKAWKLREEHKSDVLHRLEQIYGSTDSTKPFEERIIEISDQLAADAYTELQIDYPDLQDRIGFDKLSEQDFALCLKKLISESVSFTILSACEIEISDHEFSFDYINQFVSIKTLSVLGTKINDSARGVLAEIGKTVRIYDKLREKEQEKEISKKELANAPQPRYNALKRESLQEGNSKDKDNIEGGKQNGPGIRTDGRLSDSETESKSGTGGNGNEIRTSEGQISEGEIRWGENSNVSGRNAESTSSRDSGTGKREDGSPDIPDGGERRSKRTAQSTGSDALGEEDEQHPEPGGGSRTERTDLQPTNFVKPEESYTQLSLFPSAEEQRGSITAAEASKKYTMPAAFYLSETDLEVIIRSGGGQKDSRKRIYAKYTEGKSTDEIIAFLKKEYGQVGKGFELHGHPISVWFDENGMTAGYGMQAAESVVTTLSWDQIEKYIHAMITYGLYMDANEAALVDKTEMERVSYQIGYFLRDWIDDVPEELNSIEKIETLLSTHEGREQLESFLEDVDARISYGELKPKTVKSPGYLLSEIADLDRERIHFPLHDTVDVRQEDFITQDEIDYALCIGSGFADGKFRIYEYFMDLHNQKENADFLKKEYGIGGQSGALPGNSSSNSEHDAKGILLEKGSLLNPYTKVLLNWNVVEERICELIYADKYFSPQEKEEYKNYKKEQEKKAKEAEITRLNNGIRLECKQEIEKQIAEKYNGFSVPQNTVSEIVEKYGIDCVQFVLANTIVQAWKEGRFSLRNKEWASSVLTEGEWSNTLILNTHPTILDGFTNQVRNLQHEKEQVVQEQLTLDGHLCILIDQWESGNVKYLIGNCVDDPDFYYVQCENRVFEFDHKPDKVEVEDYYIDILAEEDIDRHEAEVGAKLDGEELQRLSWQVVHEADDAFGNPTKWSARLFSDVFLWINKGNAVYSIYDAEGYPPLETFESLEDAMAWADELAADGRDIENSIPDETTPDTEEKQEESKAAPDKSAASNFQISDDHLGEGSPKEKFRRNLAAIVLLNRIESENRYATAEEQQVLSQYIGWGGLADAFDESKPNWSEEYQQLKAALSPDEYRMARESTLNAHYTSPVIIRQIYSALERMGFSKGNVLEPAMGVGNFLGMMPDSMKESNLYSSYNFVGNMLYQQLFDELLVEADQNYHGVLPIRVECWMDEFGNGLRPEGFEHLITTLRSRNIAVMLFLQSISQLQTMYKGDGWKVFMDSCAVFLFLGSGRGAYDTQETISKMLGAATIEKASGSVSYGQNGSSSTSYDRLQRSLMDANEVAQMDKDSCIILPFASKPIIDKKYKPFHDPSYLKAKKYGPYTHPVEIFRDKNGNLHTVNHQEKFYFPDEGLQAKIRDDLKEGKSSGMLFELSEDEFCSLDLDDPKLNGPQGNLFLLQQLKKLEDDSATLKLQNAVNEKMNSVIYDMSDNTSSSETDEESAAETISVYDVRQSWDLSGNLEDVIRRYILELSEDEVSNITEAMNRHIPEKKIKDCLTLPPEKLCLMLQFYMKQAN